MSLWSIAIRMWWFCQSNLKNNLSEVVGMCAFIPTRSHSQRLGASHEESHTRSPSYAFTRSSVAWPVSPWGCSQARHCDTALPSGPEVPNQPTSPQPTHFVCTRKAQPVTCSRNERSGSFVFPAPPPCLLPPRRHPSSAAPLFPALHHRRAGVGSRCHVFKFPILYTQSAVTLWLSKPIFTHINKLQVQTYFNLDQIS